MVWNLSTAIETIMLSKFQTTQCEINTQFEVYYWNDLTLTADKLLLNNDSEMCVGPTTDSRLRVNTFYGEIGRGFFTQNFLWFLSVNIWR